MTAAERGFSTYSHALSVGIASAASTQFEASLQGSNPPLEPCCEGCVVGTGFGGKGTTTILLFSTFFSSVTFSRGLTGPTAEAMVSAVSELAVGDNLCPL